MTPRPPLLLLAAGLLLVAACSETAAPETPVTLAAAPQTIVLSDSALEQKLFLSTTPSGGRLNWKVASKPAWLTMSAEQGEIRRNVAEVTLSAPDLATAEPGVREGVLELISDGGIARVMLRAEVSENPRPEVVGGPLRVPASTDTVQFTLRNAGRGVLYWSSVLSNSALQVTPREGHLNSGQSVQLRLVADKQPLPVGEIDATLTIRSNARTGDLAVPVKVEVPATPVASVLVSRLGFTASIGTQAFTLYNTGKGLLTWSAASQAAWLTASPASGEVAPGASVRISTTIDRAALPGGEQSTSLVINSNSTRGPLTISAVVTSSPGLPEGLQVLDHRVVDAAYNAAANVIVTVSADPARLNVIDLLTGETASVSLPLPPSSVSIRPDGAFAAVGHDGQISYVDLQALSLVRVYPVTTDVLTLVLAGNGWVYAFPRHDQWQRIRSIDLATGLESPNTGYSIYAGTVAKLHPSGDFMYGANRGLSPSDFEKYDIRQGTAHLMYDSPYHGDHEFGGDIWISEDGLRLFARSGNVFRASSARTEDMRYAGNLAGMNWVKSLSDSQRLGRIVALAASNWGGTLSSEIRVYDQAFMAFRGTVPLPAFPVADGTTTSLGHYVFATADGERVYALVQANPQAGLARDWAIVTLAGSALP